MIDRNPDSSIKEKADRQARLEARLDEALDESFPASDPVSINIEAPNIEVSSTPKPPAKKPSDE